ncbi:hypothetical protein [Bizionia sp.]
MENHEITDQANPWVAYQQRLLLSILIFPKRVVQEKREQVPM